MLGQSGDQNYVKQIVYKTDGGVSTDKSEADIHVRYFDGLGRPVQVVDWLAADAEISLVTHIEYDGFGRQVKDYLPFATRTGLEFVPNGFEATMAFYQNYTTPTNYPYSEKFLDTSPLNRLVKQSAPGETWAGSPTGDDRTVKFVYGVNARDEVRYFSVILNSGLVPDIIDMGYYEEGTLLKIITRDENWTSGNNHTTEEFKDRDGRIVLKRTYESSVAHDTYYVYDIYGNLSFVVPPKVTGSLTPEKLDGLCYIYQYDTKNRLIIKKLPGKGPEYIIYDRLDRPVLTGPAFSPFGGNAVGWLVTKYDAFGRVAYTCWWQSADAVDNRTRESFQTILDESSVYESLGGSNVDGIFNVYSSQVFPISDYTILTINYYDGYDFPDGPTDIPSQLFDKPILNNVKGLQTGSWVRVLTVPGEISGETSYTLYDYKARPVRTFKLNYLGGITQVDTRLNFAGEVIEKVTYHKRDASDELITVTEDFTYRPQGQMELHTHKVNELDPQLISLNSYDILGRLISKEVGGTDISNGLGFQKVDYTYNIRGWLTAINHPELSDVGHVSDLFYFGIKYDDPLSAQQLFNGNISETYWKSGSDEILRKYTYTYDALNRLQRAEYWKPEQISLPLGSYDETLEYDANGNIIKLTRNGNLDDNLVTMQIDDLSFTYQEFSNRLDAVGDASNHPAGFIDGHTGTELSDYTYDGSGNMKSDLNKGIVSISYNHLNLPVRVNFSDSRKINYLYDALGRKLRKHVEFAAPVTETTEYFDGFQYVSGELAFFPHAEGYVNVTNPEDPFFDYVFNFTDHLGNIRVSWAHDFKSTTLKILEENHYYPFGLRHKNYNVFQRDFRLEEADEDGRPGIKPLEPHDKKLFKYKYNGKEWQDELGLNVTAMDFRQYDPAIGRFNSIDALSEMAPDWTPYRFAFNNPILFSDPSGLWEKKKDGSWYTNDKKDIERFMDMLSIEEATTGGASMAQVDTFIGEEFSGSGGRLSDGSALLDAVTTTFKGGRMADLSPRQISRIQSQMDSFTSNPWNEKSLSFSNPWYTYRYFRERSWSKKGGGFPGLMFGEFALAQINKKLFNANGWYSLSQMKTYSHSFHGNQYTESRLTMKNLHGFLELAGKGMAVYSLYGTGQEYMNGTLTGFGASYIGAIDGSALVSKNPYIAAASLGTGLGKSIVESEWYFNAVHDAPNW